MSVLSKERVSAFFHSLSLVAFSAMIVLTPFRLRVLLLSRPVYPVYTDFTDLFLVIADILLLTSLIFWALSLWIYPRKLAITAGNPIIGLLLLALTLSAFASVPFGEDLQLSTFHAVHFPLLLLLYLFIVNEIHSPKWILIPVALQLLIQSAVAIAQSIIQRSLGLSSLGELALDPQQTGASVVILGSTRFLRVYGFADHPNILGGCLAFGLILLLIGILYSPPRAQAILTVIFIPSFLALIATFSRSAWLGFFAACFYLAVSQLRARRWDVLKKTASLLFISVLFASPFIIKNLPLFQTRINAGNLPADYQIQERAYLLDAGNRIFIEHPITGVGIGAAPLAMKIYNPHFRLDYQPPHYALLTASMETGIIGGSFYLLLLCAPFLSIYKHRNSILENPALLAALMLLLCIAIIGLFDYYTWLYPYGRIWQWLAWALYSKALASNYL